MNSFGSGTKYEYYVFFNDADVRLARIEDLDDDIDDGELDNGVPMAPIWPHDPVIQIHEDSGDIINDFIVNIDRCLIISGNVRQVLINEEVGPECVEFLPFVLKDKKGRQVKQQYYFANPLLKYDCFDKEKSTYQAFDDGEIMMVENLHIHPEKLPENAKLFRLGEKPQFIIIRSDLAERLKTETTGFHVANMGDDIY